MARAANGICVRLIRRLRRASSRHTPASHNAVPAIDAFQFATRSFILKARAVRAPLDRGALSRKCPSYRYFHTIIGGSRLACALPLCVSAGSATFGRPSASLRVARYAVQRLEGQSTDARMGGRSRKLRIGLAGRGYPGEAAFGPLGLIAHTVEASFSRRRDQDPDPVNTRADCAGA